MQNNATLHLLAHLLDDSLPSSNVVGNLIAHVEKAYLINFCLVVQAGLKDFHQPNPLALRRTGRSGLALACIRRS